MYYTAYLTLNVQDLDRAVRFYTETLGLPLKARHGDFWAEVEAPGVRIGLHPSEGTPQQGDAISLGLMVDDLDAAIRTLSERGVAFTQVTKTERASSASFADPDGTPLYLMWRAERA